jgi:hypothetical protein
MSHASNSIDTLVPRDEWGTVAQRRCSGHGYRHRFEHSVGGYTCKRRHTCNAPYVNNLDNLLGLPSFGRYLVVGLIARLDSINCSAEYSTMTRETYSLEMTAPSQCAAQARGRGPIQKVVLRLMSSRRHGTPR